MGDFISLYKPETFVSVAGKLLLPGISYESFFYPPTSLLIFGPLAHLPFEVAAFGWIVFSSAFSIYLLRLAGFQWRVITVGLAAPASLLDYQLGQFGVLTSAILLASIHLGQRRAFAGGSLGGLFVIKPQLGLLLPFLWISKRNWRALAGISVAGTCIIFLSLWVFGLPAWQAYFNLGQAQSLHILSAPFDPHSAQGWGVSIYWMIRSFGFSTHDANMVQALAAVLSIILLFKPPWHADKSCLAIICLSLLATPYANTPDMVAYSLMLAESARQRGWRIGLLDALLFLWPGLCLVISIATGHELTPFIVLAALLRAALRASPPVLPAPAQE